MTKLEELHEQEKIIDQMIRDYEKSKIAIQAEITKAEQVYPDGTPGLFSDDEYEHIFGYLINTTDKFWPYKRAPISGNSDAGALWKNFEPLTEAILPNPIPWNGEGYPGKSLNDEIRVQYNDGSISHGFANEWVWPGNSKKQIWIIKAGE